MGTVGWRRFHEQVEIGYTKYKRADIRALITTMGNEYSGKSYHTTKRNCNHFTDDFCQRICGNGIPGWVNRAAKVTGAIGSTFIRGVSGCSVR